MRRLSLLTLLLVAGVIVFACDAARPSPTGTAAPSSPPATSPPPSATPAATLDTSIFLPLPEVVAGLPLGGGTPTAEVEPQSTGGLPPDATVGHPYELGHCGLLQPIDFDGSLWVQQGGHNGVGQPLTQEQVGELINATPVRIFLLDEQRALLVTPMNAFVLLERHDGSREYALCD